jgi:hypothetical protein
MVMKRGEVNNMYVLENMHCITHLVLESQTYNYISAAKA